MYLEKELPLMFAERPSVSTAVEEKTQRTSSAVVTAPPSVGTKTAEKPVYDFIKRVCDVFCSFFGLVVLSPFFLLVSLMIKLERSGKGVFFKQKRLGKNGKYIYVYKFRTMINDAENVGKWLNEKQIVQYYREYKVDNDPRVTKVGKMLRRTGLDELPQLINILRGDLSLVGPRPIQETEAELYGVDKDLLLSVNPGLTGYWQVYCSGDVTYSNKKRQKMELFYVTHRNLGWDIKLCFATVGAIVRKAKRGQ
ncbi:MAG: sugar transferase [Ruminococcaceae bacterium]|nr:sugar transferase [Oscillospiraceae bacterium]